VTENNDYVAELVRGLLQSRRETEWLEFKRNNDDPKEIGEYISALANGAALHGKSHGFVIWGIDNETLEIAGTVFDPATAKVGNEELESWLLRLLEPKLDFEFLAGQIDDKPVVVLQMDAAFRHPVRFKRQAYIRVGTYKKPLEQHPERERKLWRVLDKTLFEAQVASTRVSDEAVLELLDYPAYFSLLDQPVPESNQLALEALAADKLIEQCEAGGWNVLNLGAILLARKLSKFQLDRKVIRVIQYHGTTRVQTIREQPGVRGYASGFAGLVEYVNGLLPTNEIIQKALRRTVPMYPELAIRELIANALIHQDFSITGAGPMIEIFEDRVEITNPGQPIVDPQRFMDAPPRSRNEHVASLMRRFGVCEERGSGIDKVVHTVEAYQLPAPLFEATEGSTRAVLFAPKPLKNMSKEERVSACYWHACLKHVTHGFLTNSSIRERFRISKENSAHATRIINSAVEARVIAPHDPEASRRHMKYVPWWAKPDS
jgi:predicted HTH transcriptional regulator